MISPQFYTDDNVAQVYLGGKRPHYLQKSRDVTIEGYDYAMDFGEDMYTLGLKLFGQTQLRNWTYIADGNKLKMPDEWEAGDVIKLPTVILQPETPDTFVTNGQSTSATI